MKKSEELLNELRKTLFEVGELQVRKLVMEQEIALKSQHAINVDKQRAEVVAQEDEIQKKFEETKAPEQVKE